MLLFLLGCADPPPPPPDATVGDTAAPAEAVYTPLEAPRLLRRMSLDLRGVLPATDELDAVEADPALLAGYRDAYLASPLLEERLVYLFQERWHTRIEDFQIDHEGYFLDDAYAHPFDRAVGEEPLRLLAHVATRDLPWSEATTAGYTMADPLLLDIWPLEALEDADGEGWVPAAYTDGRPAAGVLASTGMWLRYTTSDSNMNRERVAALTRLLICEDYLARPVSFSRSAGLDTEQTTEALRSDPACMGCHSSLDPIAATLFGFYNGIAYNAYEMDTYHPERELLGAAVMGVSPAYYGQPLSGLADLGRKVAADPRFVRCAARTAAEGLWRRDAGSDDYDTIEALRQVFDDSDLRFTSLLAAVTDTDEYRAAAGPAHTVTRRLMPPSMLASTLEDLSGFAWVEDGYRQLDSDEYGYRVLAGGVDGEQVTAPQKTPGLTWALVTREATWSAASTLVAGEPERFSGPSADPDALAAWWWQLLAERPTDDELDGLVTLWEDAEALAGPEAAWTVTLSALLRHPDFVTY